MNKKDIIKKVTNKLPSTIDVTKLQHIEESNIGYFGRIDSKDFISYKDLCDQLSFHDGKLMNDNGWLAFWYKGSVLFISQHPVRHDISWDIINEHNLVFGERTININNNNYSVMLPTGGDDDNKGEHSMWNDLIYKVHKDYGTWDKLSNVDLCTGWDECPTGSASWCQENYDDDIRYRTHRGLLRLSFLDASTSSFADDGIGSRFVLKLNLDKLNKDKNTVNVTNIEYKPKYSPCKICGDIGSYYDDDDKLVKCCDPKSKEVIHITKVDEDKSIINKNNKYDKYMMDTAVIWKTLSVCKRNQVGCVIGTESGRILVNGYNGTVSGTDNDCEKVCNVCNGKDVECDRCNNERKITSDFVVHAEQNAIAFAAKEGIKLKGTILYTTTSPCPVCAKLIASTGISRVVYLEEYKDKSGIDFLNKYGVSCTKL